MTDLPRTGSDLRTWRGRTVVDQHNDKIGKLVDVYVDDVTRQPEWLAVQTGLFGNRISFLPIEGANIRGDDEVVTPYTKQLVKDSPNAEPDRHLDPAEERRLYQHYEGSYISGRYADHTKDTGRERSDYERTRGADSGMVRSEEELRVEKTSQEVGQARLRKWVETEDVNITVPVTRERARVVTEPITPGTAPRGDLTDDERTITLSEEQIDVTKTTVPKERVRLEAETVTEDEQVSETVRKERISSEGDIEDTNRRS